VLGPDKEVHEVVLTPAHEHPPWRGLTPRIREHETARREPAALELGF
jgi:hypothetical protein